MRVFDGALKQIRTADLVLTKDALYRLSYESIFNFRTENLPTIPPTTGMNLDNIRYPYLSHTFLKNRLEPGFFVLLALR